MFKTMLLVMGSFLLFTHSMNAQVVMKLDYRTKYTTCFEYRWETDIEVIMNHVTQTEGAVRVEYLLNWFGMPIVEHPYRNDEDTCGIGLGEEQLDSLLAMYGDTIVVQIDSVRSLAITVMECNLIVCRENGSMQTRCESPFGYGHIPLGYYFVRRLNTSSRRQLQLLRTYLSELEVK